MMWSPVVWRAVPAANEIYDADQMLTRGVQEKILQH
jgi:hypothetical protein